MKFSAPVPYAIISVVMSNCDKIKLQMVLIIGL